MSFGSLALIIFIAVMLFGPDKIPGIARGLGQGIRQMKRAADDIKDEIMSQVEDPKVHVEEIKETLKETTENIAKVQDYLDDSFEGPIKRK